MKLTWRTLLQIHIYLGLFCLPYLIIFSLSSLDFNHHFLPATPLLQDQLWETTVDIPLHDDLEAFSEELKDSLDLFGWFLPWDSYRDSSQAVIVLSRPGKRLDITVDSGGKVLVEEKAESTANLMKILHFLGEDIPNAPWWVNTWKYYQDLTVYSMIFWVVTGIILWLRKKKRPDIEDRLLWTAGIVSIIFIVFIWLRK